MFTFSFAVIILGLLSANTAFSTEENPTFSISAGQSFRPEKEDVLRRYHLQPTDNIFQIAGSAQHIARRLQRR